MRTRVRHTTVLTLGSAASGLLAYVFFAIATRALGSVDAAPVSVLWAYWSFAGAAFTFPLQHWVARSVAAHAGEGAVRTALPGVAAVTAVAAVLATGASWLARGLLFGTDAPWFPLLVGGVTLGAAAMGLVRGILSARGRFASVAAGILAENAVRCLVAVGLVVADVDAAVAYGLALLAGYLVIAQPSVYRLRRDGEPERESPLAFLGGTAGGQLLGQAVLTGGPVVLALAGGAPADVTALFAALALFRAPYTLALGVVAQVTGWFTRLVVERRVDALRRHRHRLLAGTAAASVAAAAVGALAGPWLLRLIFGDDVVLAPLLAAAVAVGSTLAMANLVVTLVVLAHGRTERLVLSWALALLPGVAWFVVPDVAHLDRTVGAFLVIEAAALALLLREEVHATAALRG